MKTILLSVCTSLTLMAGAQVSGLQSTFPNGNNPVMLSQQKTYTNCSYVQESNAFEDGNVSNTLFPNIGADDFTIPAGECWDIEDITANFFTNNPTDASAMNIYFYADAAGEPGAILNSYIASPSDWSTTLLGNNFSIDIHEFDVHLPTPINLCGGVSGTTYWFSIQAVNSIINADFYWETVATGSPYGNDMKTSSSTSGPWDASYLQNFVFELKRTIVNDLTMTECEGFSITVGTNTYTTTGVTQDILTSVNGCDSIVNLDLTILPHSTGTDTQVSCNAIVWIDGNTYSSNNTTATHNLVAGAANGCDSLVTLDLTINPYTGTDTQVACNSFSWIDGNTYTASNSIATHYLSGGAIDGCDSLVTLNLTINNSTTGTDVQAACPPYTWIDGNTYNTDNSTATYTIVGGSANGCDSLVTLDYTATTFVTGTDTQNTCGPITWIDGNTYTANNMTASHTIVGGSATGCDSIVTLNLTISTPPNNAVTLTNATIMATEAGAIYQWIDCDNGNSGITGEMNQTFTPSTTGNYAVEITLNGCTVTSTCTLVDYTSIQENAKSLVTIYPNPTSSVITISVNSSSFSYQVMNILGEVVMSNTASEFETVDLSKFSNGVYFVKVTVDNSEETIKVVKK